MKNSSQEHESQNHSHPAEQQEHHSKHDTPSWARKYLDLADRAFSSSGANEDSGQRN